ncbi:hypothetical protein RHMOL_Rhmol10G0122400 [Rhododendron molle]|uniref:Uncharacterized protein n=1 Tax=Rhododendron molle TaxID=49168 RepID=A0ACC0M1Y2_RHOML|nr:hypothetical protein RHMOL_Rhmol10G0122400 [Rhododendron molle]
MGKKKGKGTKFTRCFKAPFRFLIKARDFYVRAMCDWAARFEKCGGATGYYAVAQFSIPPDSYGFHSSRNSMQNEELMELMRATSARNQNNRVDDKSEILWRLPCVKSTIAGGSSARRRGRVGIERIEEDMPCLLQMGNEFQRDDAVGIEATLIVCKIIRTPGCIDSAG